MQEQSTQNWRYLVNNFFTCSFLIKCSTKFNKGQFFYGACSPIAGHGLLMLEVFRDHAQRHTTVGRTPVGEWSARHRDLYLTTHNTHNRQTSMPPAGFEPTISAGERPQTYALDRAAIGTGKKKEQLINHNLELAVAALLRLMVLHLRFNKYIFVFVFQHKVKLRASGLVLCAFRKCVWKY